jgi:hypothetical protein
MNHDHFKKSGDRTVGKPIKPGDGVMDIAHLQLLDDTVTGLSCTAYAVTLFDWRHV